MESYHAGTGPSPLDPWAPAGCLCFLYHYLHLSNTLSSCFIVWVWDVMLVTVRPCRFVSETFHNQNGKCIIFLPSMPMNLKYWYFSFFGLAIKKFRLRCKFFCNFTHRPAHRECGEARVSARLGHSYVPFCYKEAWQNTCLRQLPGETHCWSWTPQQFLLPGTLPWELIYFVHTGKYIVLWMMPVLSNHVEKEAVSRIT